MRLSQSQRDLSLQVPINYVVAAGVSFTPACFAHNRYEDQKAAKCFSNLLAIGFHRFEVDVYWDASRHIWSLCPVELGDAASITTRSTTSSTSSSSTSNAGGRKRDLDAVELLDVHHLRARQATSSQQTTSVASTKTLNTLGLTNASPTSKATTTNPTTGSSTSSTSATSTSAPLIDVGPYSCTKTINLALYIKVLAAHLGSTQNSLNATVKYLILNLHAAAPASDPLGSAHAPLSADLPKANSLLSSVMSVDASQYLYTPDDLRQERSDLNASDSWYGGLRDFQPDPAYFHVHGSGDNFATADGWPSESFVEMGYGKRMLAGYGQVDPQLKAYNFSADASVIFGQDYLQSNVSVTLHDTGRISTGCFFRPGVLSLGSVNNSWAVSANTASPAAGVMPLQPLLAEASNVTYCGISTVLNETLNQVTADQDFKPYEQYVQNTIWSWGPTEPHNSSRNADSPTQNRCAALNAVSGYWQTENCAQAHYSACRRPGGIYDWAISSSATEYANAELPCPGGTLFSVPRTALENTYLLNKWQQTRAKPNAEIQDDLLWVNFNDLDVQACWVVGQNETCPYLPSHTDDRTVVVPTVAAVIVFVLAALTVFVKCAANRRQSKSRRRRGDDGWDYEGVPS